MSDPESQLRALCDQAMDEVRNYEALSRSQVSASVTFELVWSRALVKAAGPNKEIREAHARLACEPELREKREADRALDVSAKRLSLLRQTISAKQTECSNARALS